LRKFHSDLLDFLNNKAHFQKTVNYQYYVFYRLTINKYNLDYQITSYNRDLTDEVKAYSLDKNSPNYYLIDLFKDREALFPRYHFFFYSLISREFYLRHLTKIQFLQVTISIQTSVGV